MYSQIIVISTAHCHLLAGLLNLGRYLNNQLPFLIYFFVLFWVKCRF